MRRVSSGLRTAVWLGLLALVAVGGAGLIVGVDPPPTDARRPELTARGDQRFARAAPALQDTVTGLSEEADALAAAARSASRGLRALDPGAARDGVRQGEAALQAVDVAGQEMTAAHEALLTAIDGAALGTSNQARLAAALDAESAMETLPEAWSRVVAAVSRAAAMLDALERHDEAIAAATEAAREAATGAPDGGGYVPALGSLDAASAQRAAIAALRDGVPQGSDTPALDDWLARAGAHDDALRRLYEALQASGGRSTDATAAAQREVEALQGALPVGREVFLAMVTEMTEPGLTEALVAIEQARGIMRDAEVALD